MAVQEVLLAHWTIFPPLGCVPKEWHRSLKVVYRVIDVYFEVMLIFEDELNIQRTQSAVRSCLSSVSSTHASFWKRVSQQNTSRL